MTLDQIPLVYELRGDHDGLPGRLEDYHWLRAEGHTIAQAAERMRLTKRTAERYERRLRTVHNPPVDAALPLGYGDADTARNSRETP